MGTPVSPDGARELYMRMVLHEVGTQGEHNPLKLNMPLSRMEEMARFATTAMFAFEAFEKSNAPVKQPVAAETPVPNELHREGERIISLDGVKEYFIGLTERKSEILHLGSRSWCE